MKDIAAQAIPILLKYNVRKATFFGSYARGDFDNSSDVDILIEPPKGMGLGFIDLKIELEDTLRKKVDLVSYNGIDRYLKESVLKDQKAIL